MTFSDIMAETALPTEKSCLVAHATHFVAVLNALALAAVAAPCIRP